MHGRHQECLSSIHATYKGAIATNNFELGIWLNNPAVQQLNVQGQIDGKGLSWEAAHFQLEANVGCSGNVMVKGFWPVFHNCSRKYKNGCVHEITTEIFASSVVHTSCLSHCDRHPRSTTSSVDQSLEWKMLARWQSCIE